MARIPLVSLLSSVYTVNESIYVEVAVTFIFFYKVAQVPWSNASVNGRLHLLATVNNVTTVMYYARRTS